MIGDPGTRSLSPLNANLWDNLYTQKANFEKAPVGMLPSCLKEYFRINFTNKMAKCMP